MRLTIDNAISSPNEIPVRSSSLQDLKRERSLKARHAIPATMTGILGPSSVLIASTMTQSAKSVGGDGMKRNASAQQVVTEVTRLMMARAKGGITGTATLTSVLKTGTQNLSFLKLAQKLLVSEGENTSDERVKGMDLRKIKFDLRLPPIRENYMSESASLLGGSRNATTMITPP
jgi:hypothetical protein